MITPSTSTSSSFLQRIGAVLERVEYRCASTVEDEQLIYRARNMSRPRQDGEREFAKQAGGDSGPDASLNRYDIMMLLDAEFVGAFRIHVGSGASAALPSRAAFSDVVSPLLVADRVIVELNQIEMAPEIAGKFAELPYLVIRAAWLAAEHFDAEIITTMCPADQRSVYARSFAFEPLGSPRSVPPSDRALVCMALDVPAKKEAVERRFPFFRSTPAERRAIFGSVRSRSADEQSYVFEEGARTQAEYARLNRV